MCNKCIHKAVCGKHKATGGHVRECEHFLPGVAQTVPVQTVHATILLNKHDVVSMGYGGADMDQYIRMAIAKELAQHLAFSPYMRYQQRDLPTGDVEFNALVRVVDTQEGEEP